jgi:DNA-damage-inducible protein J
MGAVNVTIRVDEDTKREFDAFCAGVGMNITTAIHLYMKAVIRTRELPFPITDVAIAKSPNKQALRNAFTKAQAKGRDRMSMEEINEKIGR